MKIATTMRDVSPVYKRILGKDIYYYLDVLPQEVEGLIVDIGNRYFGRDTLEEFPNLKWIASPTTGLNHIDLSYLEERNIGLLSLKGQVNFLKEVWATAEHTIALVFALSKNLLPYFRQIEHAEYRRTIVNHELHGATLGIIGFGRVGKQVCQLATFLGMEVIHADIKDPSYKDDLKRTIRQSDFLSIHVDLNDSSRNMIDMDFFKQMHSSQYFINTSRGEVVDEYALLYALEHKKIAGAAIDVIQNEHEGVKNRLLFKYVREYDNLLITPHVAGNTKESRHKTDEYIAQKIKELIMP